MKNNYELLFQEEERYGDGNIVIQKFKANNDSEALAIVLNDMSLGDFVLDFEEDAIVDSDDDIYDLNDLKHILDTDNGDGGYVVYLKNLSTKQLVYSGIPIQNLGILELPLKDVEYEDPDLD